ncbi:MAG: nitrilase-related carbon-nitrogen hydrolase [Pirellulales bacterium]
MPAAFTKTTGRDHWELLCRARAVENQCFVAASNQTGKHAVLETYGHSLIVDPWGEVLARAEEGETVLHAVLSAERLAQVCANSPALAHCRTL